eukprot:scaffold16556_cov63-Phaeocystis_antarctica.AAC.1
MAAANALARLTRLTSYAAPTVSACSAPRCSLRHAQPSAMLASLSSNLPWQRRQSARQSCSSSRSAAACCSAAALASLGPPAPPAAPPAAVVPAACMPSSVRLASPQQASALACSPCSRASTARSRQQPRLELDSSFFLTASVRAL